MLTTQQKYSKIMEVMADKTLSFGCSVLTGRNGYNSAQKFIAIGKDRYILDDYYDFDLVTREDWQIEEVIGHPLHIGDVLYWIENNRAWHIEEQSEIIPLWKDKRIPLSVEDIELVDYIFNLI